MKLKDQFKVEYVSNQLDVETRNFLKKWHYSKSYRSLQQKHVFKLIQDNILVGVAVYGKPMSIHHSSDIIELRRLCLIDNTPKNSESFFIAKTLKWMDKNTTYNQVISFADPNKGHIGTIYRASNFEYFGTEDSQNPRVLVYKNKDIHMRQLYQKKNGSYTKNAIMYQSLVESGKAKIEKREKKHKYVYYFRG